MVSFNPFFLIDFYEHDVHFLYLNIKHHFILFFYRNMLNKAFFALELHKNYDYCYQSHFVI